METQHNNNATQQHENTDATQQPESMAFDFDGEFLGPVEEGEASGVTGMEEEEERNVAFLPLNPDFWGCAHLRPAQAEHACCNYGQPEEPEEDITDVQEGVSVMFCSLLLLFFFLSYLFFCSQEQFFPSEPIWEWSFPLFL